MSSPGRTPSRPAVALGSTSVRHLTTHQDLLHVEPRRLVPSARPSRGRVDAIIVPTWRPASALSSLIALAAATETPIVVLCSGQANPGQVVDRVERVPGARAVVVEITRQGLPLPDFETSHADFAFASGDRESDLSAKRNFGLLLARAMGWRKIVYLDDDIAISPAEVARIADQLENHEIVGMACRRFPDNSVFCHARRLAKMPQDVFVTGAVLGVNCADLPLPFFPDIYNEDWFFFGEAAACRSLTKAGEARQAEYDPFATVQRAMHEEFGDLMAEGLYALIQGLGPGYSFYDVTKYANANYWRCFITVRQEGLDEALEKLDRFASRANCSDSVAAAVRSLKAAKGCYEERITHDRCDQFLDAWRRDVDTWGGVCMTNNNLGSIEDAMDWLSPVSWQAVRR